MAGIIPVPPVPNTQSKFFGRRKGGAIRDRVVLSLGSEAIAQPPFGRDSKEVIVAFDADE